MKHRVRTQVTLQMEAVECGAACLLMILRYYGCYHTLDEVREACSVSRNGSNAADMVLAARGYGLEGGGFKVPLEDLQKLEFPCILHWDFNHFVVLEGVDKHHAWINDPRSGRRKVSMEELDHSFTGIVLQFKPGANFRKYGKESSVWDTLKTIPQKEGTGTLFLFLVGAALIVPGLAMPILSKIFVDDVLMGQDRSWVNVLLIGMAIAFGGQLILNYMRSIVLSRMKIKFSLEENHSIVSRMLRLPMSYFEQRFAGDLSQRQEAIDRVYSFMSGGFSDTVLYTAEAVIYLVFMMIYSPILALLSLLGTMVNILCLRLITNTLAGLSMKSTKDRNRIVGRLCSGITAYATIKASGAEDDYAAMMISSYQAGNRSEQRMSRTQQILNSIPGILTQVMNLVILICGAVMVIHSTLTTGVLVAFLQFLGSFLAPVNSIMTLQQQMQTLRADLAMMGDMKDLKEDPRFSEDVDQSFGVDKPATGLMEVRNITFGYDRGLPPVIKNVSFKAMPGSRIGIVGASGSGKSTLGKLLTGLLTPWEGEILFDGVPISRIPSESFAESIGVTVQKEAFFAGSIRDNLTLWNNQYTDQEITEALKDAEAFRLVSSLPDDVDYPMAEGGKNFSGGQLQQFALARSLLRNPAILLLDEATSAMDTLREKAVMDNLRKRNCLTLIIAHRLSTVIDADLILVVDDGQIKEYGTHEELMNKGGIYTSLYKGKEG